MYALNKKPLPDVSFSDCYLVNQSGPTLALGGNGQIVSCNPPDGHFELRDPGTCGPYEQMVLDGGTATYMPVSGQVYVFAIKRVPNA